MCLTFGLKILIVLLDLGFIHFNSGWSRCCAAVIMIRRFQKKNKTNKTKHETFPKCSSLEKERERERGGRKVEMRDDAGKKKRKTTERKE